MNSLRRVARFAVPLCLLLVAVAAWGRIQEANRPERAVMIFIDTLRADHLGSYGYARSTSPAIDQFAKGAVVFDAAHSVAPWTLPSAKAVLSGRHPDWWEATATLQGRLRARGFKTAFFSANNWMSPDVGMRRDWDTYNLQHGALAETQVERAVQWLGAHSNDDVLLVLHLMDMHQPYKEPTAYRRLFAGDAVAPLGEEIRDRIALSELKSPAARQYVIDRYDNNLRYIDDSLKVLFSVLDRWDLVFLFSDHGEEFWDHDSFGHGHTLYEELLRVPLIVRAPGLAPRRISAPVSLLDLTPTLLDLLSIPVKGLDGQSLVPLLRGDPTAGARMAQRPLPIGWPLYGAVRWGVLNGERKYSTWAGREFLFDLKQDPGEHVNRAEGRRSSELTPHRAALAKALKREIALTLRVSSDAKDLKDGPGVLLRCRVPGGWRKAWVGHDPDVAAAAEVTIDGETVVMQWPEGYRHGRQLYALPRRALTEVGTLLQCDVHNGSEWARIPLSIADLSNSTARPPLWSQTVQEINQITLDVSSVPVPPDDLPQPKPLSDRTFEALRSIGYVGQ
ncbi:MAG: sulfatase [Acidobacteriota bacterium]